MNVEEADRDWNHLYPEFRELLRLTLDETEKVTGCKWFMAEGFRSVERQLWLYASGRTRPGPWLTGMKYPVNHGAGLAADCYPEIENPPHSHFLALRTVYMGHGLQNPAWGRGDYGHIELVDPKIHEMAVEWVQEGFQGDPRREERPVRLEGDRGTVLVEGLVDGTSTLLPVRAVANAFGIKLSAPTGSQVVLESPTSGGIIYLMTVVGGTGYVRAKERWGLLGLDVAWEPPQVVVRRSKVIP